jgi:hypothetical protein
MASPTHVVTRSFGGPAGPLLPGQEVDAADWRNTELLVKRRFLRPIERPQTRIPTPAPIDDRSLPGRRKKGGNS